MKTIAVGICLLAATVDAAAEEVAAGQVSVKIDGPATAIAGEKLYLTLQEKGPVRSRVWSVLPAGSVGFDTREGGLRADFATRFSGTYVFVVSVAGADGSVAHAFHAVELRDNAGQTPPQPGPASNGPLRPDASHSPPAPGASPPLATPQGGPDVPSLILAWAAQTPSTNRRAEAALIAGQLNAVAAQIDSGTNASADLMADARGACAAAMGDRYAAWSPFFDQLGRLFADMRRRGAMPGRENFSAALRSAANVLERL